MRAQDLVAWIGDAAEELRAVARIKASIQRDDRTQIIGLQFPFLRIVARTDDVINVAGHRLSTGAMEEVLSSHPDVAECAVIGVADKLKGQMPLGFLCLRKGAANPPETVVSEVVALVRERIGPVAAFRSACVVDRLPKTRSGKILRATMAKIADGEEYRMPATIDDPTILDEIRKALNDIGQVPK